MRLRPLAKWERERERDVERAYEVLVDALEDNFPDVRIAALKVLPSFALRRQGRGYYSTAFLTGCKTMRDQ